MTKNSGSDGDPGESSAELSLPDAVTKVPAAGRITLGFSGPDLRLPDADAAASAAELALDTSELGSPPRKPPEPDEAELELDLSELPVGVAGAADAWKRDHRRRSTPPPAPGFAAATAATLPAPPSPRPEPRSRAADGGAWGLVERSRPSQPELDLAAEMAERYALGDFTGALRAAELLLGRDEHHPDARRYAESSRERLAQLYESRLGDLSRVPQVTVPASEIRWLGLDHRAGFLLSRVDGNGTVEQLIDVSGMPRLEALKTLVELLDAGAVELS